MKVLIVWADLFGAAPSGPAYVAGAARAAGHTVEVFECITAADLLDDLSAHVDRFAPEVIGLSIRLVNGRVVRDGRDGFACERFDVRPQVRQIVDRLRAITSATIVLGGPGFNYFGPAWLDTLDLDFGIRGEAENAFPLYLGRLAAGQDLTCVPGAVYRRNDGFGKTPREWIADLDATALPAYDLFDMERQAARGVKPAVFTKRGCAFRCTFCPYANLEGARYRLKSPARVVDEMAFIRQSTGASEVQFADNSFNVPRPHAAAICREIIDRQPGVAWHTGALKPVGVDAELVRLMAESGCTYLGLSVETASPRMLKSIRRGYTQDQVRRAMDALSAGSIPWGVSLLFGFPGETPETIAETLAVIDDYEVPNGIWVSIGINLWTNHQAVVEEARAAGQLADDRALFDGADYISPALPRDYMEALIATLQARPDVTVQVNKGYVEAAG